MAKELFKIIYSWIQILQKAATHKMHPHGFWKTPMLQEQSFRSKKELVKLCTTIPVGWFVLSHQNQHA
jgi:hypothetical protein